MSQLHNGKNIAMYVFTRARERSAHAVVLFLVALVMLVSGLNSTALAEKKSPQKKALLHETASSKNEVDSSAVVSIKSANRRDRLVAIDQHRSGKKAVSSQELRTARSNESDPLLRYRLNQALAEMSISEIETDLITSLQSDPSALVRVGAAQSLGNYVQNRAVVRALAQALPSDEDVAVRRAALRSLSLSKSARALSAIESAITSTDVSVRRQAAYSLSRMKGVRPALLLKSLQRDSDAHVRRLAGANR